MSNWKKYKNEDWFSVDAKGLIEGDLYVKDLTYQEAKKLAEKYRSNEKISYLEIIFTDWAYPDGNKLDTYQEVIWSCRKKPCRFEIEEDFSIGAVGWAV